MAHRVRRDQPTAVYATAIRTPGLLPNATIEVDRFHVVKIANEAGDQRSSTRHLGRSRRRGMRMSTRTTPAGFPRPGLPKKSCGPRCVHGARRWETHTSPGIGCTGSYRDGRHASRFTRDPRHTHRPCYGTVEAAQDGSTTNERALVLCQGDGSTVPHFVRLLVEEVWVKPAGSSALPVGGPLC